MKLFKRTVYSIVAGALIFSPSPANAFDMRNSIGFFAIACGSVALGFASKLAFDAHMKGKNLFNSLNSRIQKAHKMRGQAHELSANAVDAVERQYASLKELGNNIEDGNELLSQSRNINSSYNGLSQGALQILSAQEKSKNALPNLVNNHQKNVAHLKGVIYGAFLGTLHKNKAQHLKQLSKIQNAQNDLQVINKHAQAILGNFNDEKKELQKFCEESKLRQKNLLVGADVQKMGTRAMKIK